MRAERGGMLHIMLLRLMMMLSASAQLIGYSYIPMPRVTVKLDRQHAMQHDRD